jgi:hypothetical protein
VDGEWSANFRRPLSVREYERWSELKGEPAGLVLDEEGSDMVKWGLEKNGLFSTKSLYRFITDGGAASRLAGYLWKCKIPLKIKFFLWQIFNNKL